MGMIKGVLPPKGQIAGPVGLRKIPTQRPVLVESQTGQRAPPSSLCSWLCYNTRVR